MTSPEDVALSLVEKGLTDARCLEGRVGLKHFERHGLTEENQAAVVAAVQRLLPPLPDPLEA